MADLLITSLKATRRLQLLLHGAPPSPGASPVKPPAVAPTAAAKATAASTAAAPPAQCLPAALLAEPAPASAYGGDGKQQQAWLRERDVLAEVAVTPRTLLSLKLPVGALVVVSNAGRPFVQPRLARLLALPSPMADGDDGVAAASAAAPHDGCAYLAPSLAFNLGLALHLVPLLAGAPEGSAGSNGSSSSTAGSSSGCEQVRLWRYAPPEPAEGEQPGSHWHRAAQPGSEAAALPVAAEVHVSLVRAPAAALLQQRADPHSGGGEDAEAEAGAANGRDGRATAAGSARGSAGAASSSSAPGPGQAASDSAVAALQHWFLQAPRVVCPGDVLAVPRLPPSAGGGGELWPQLLPNLHTGEQAAAAAQAAPAAPPPLLYFRVAQLVVPPAQAAIVAAAAAAVGGAAASAAAPLAAAAVDVGTTMVKLAGSCSSGLPVGLPHYLAAAAGGNSGSSSDGSAALLGSHVAAASAHAPLLPPAGLLLPAWRQLAQLLASVLHPGAAGVPLRLAVLLHGPSGSGKQTAVQAAAAAVGCHLVSLSCHDVKAAAGAAERHTFEGLRASFSAAADYAPAVLVLRQLSVLGDGSSHGGSGAASAQSYAARLGSVLADCIRSHGGGSKSSRQQPGEGLHPAPVILVACTSSADDLPAPLRRCFTHELSLEAPDQRQRQALLLDSLAGVPALPGLAAAAAAAAAGKEGEESPGGQAAALAGVDLEETVRHTAGLLPRELRAVAADAAAAAALQALPPAAVLSAGEAEGQDGGADGGSRPQQGAAPPALSPQHLSAAVEAVRQRTATEIGAPRIPSVKWEDVGGLHDVKRAILDTVELPLKHPELFSGGLRRRSGVLLYGPPGTGKTLLAKAVATECAISFLSVKGPELINMYVGESERQIREVFARARRARPCVVFFDELDALAPARGRGSDSGGVMDRVVGQLLAEIDGAQGDGGGESDGGGGGGGGGVFVVGATNRPDLLDPALLRPGRLDRLLYVGIAADAESRLQVIQALTRRFKLAPCVDLHAVAAACAPRFTGADLYALCSDAWMGALRRTIAAADEASSGGSAAAVDGGGGKEEEGEVVVTQADFMASAASVQPSLSAEEVGRYEALRDQYAGGGAGGGAPS